MNELNFPETKDELYWLDVYKSTSYSVFVNQLNEYITQLNYTIISIWNDTTTITKKQMDLLYAKIKEVDIVYSNLRTNLGIELPKIADEVTITKVLSKTAIQNNKVQGYTLAALFSSVKIQRDLKSALLNTADTTTQDVMLNVDRVKRTKTSQMDTAITQSISETRELQKEKDYNNIENSGIFDPTEYYYLSVGVLDSHTTQICRTLDGMKYFTSYDLIPNKPKRHWNCRSLLVLMVTEPDEMKRATKSGPIGYTTYQDWLKTN